MLFKILVLQRTYNISDDQTEFQINDRMSFMRFLGLSLGDKVPDTKTIWLFRENLTRTDTVQKLFDKFDKILSPTLERLLMQHSSMRLDNATQEKKTRKSRKAKHLKSG